MRESFPGYYRPTDEEFNEMWNTCLFVLDTNVLLNLYRYSSDTKEELLAILEDLSDRLWVPHQVAFEYQRRRLDVIWEQKSRYNDVRELLSEKRKRLENELRKIVGRGRHPFIDPKNWMVRIDELFKEIESETKELEEEHPDWLSDDTIRQSITALLRGEIGAPYGPEVLREIYKKGGSRYADKVPPGYKDEEDKEGERKYGDLVLWHQIIDKAKEENQPIIFVTDDRKEDWWWKFKGRTIGPRPELVEEIQDQAGVKFYMYSTDPFMKYAGVYLKRNISQSAIDEARETRELDETKISAEPNAGTERRLLALIDELLSLRSERQFLKIKRDKKRQSLADLERQAMKDLPTMSGKQFENYEGKQEFLQEELNRLESLNRGLGNEIAVIENELSQFSLGAISNYINLDTSPQSSNKYELLKRDSIFRKWLSRYIEHSFLEE
jgi:predicted nucleic acid-binding protein